MGFNIEEVKASKNILPPRIVLYGTPKIGKTTFAASVPDNLLIDIEGGSGLHNIARVEKDDVQSYAAFKDVLAQVENGNHAFQCLTIDTVDWLETILFEEAARQHGKKAIADVPYGAGYGTAQMLWNETLDALDRIREKRGVMILMLAHEQIRRYDDPQAGSYDRYTLKLQDKDKGSSSVSIIKEWCDAILFVDMQTFTSSETVGFNQKVKRASGGERMIYATESPAFVAGNRFGLPSEIPFTWQALSEALTQSISN